MKKKNYLGRIIGLCMIALITANALLIYFDNHGKVERKSYINQWSKTITYNLYNTFKAKGVFASDDSNEVYFDDQVGAFQKFLVTEGDSVQEGDDLYTYEVVDYNQQHTELESKISQLEDERDALDSYINEMESIDIPEPNGPSSSTSSFPSAPGSSSANSSSEFSQFNSSANSIPSSSSSANGNRAAYAQAKVEKQKAIAEKELEMSQKEAMISMVEDQLDQLEESGQTITVTSPFSGTVTNISKDLNDPLLTMQSTNLLVKGELNEEKRAETEENMTARIDVPDLELHMTGSVSSLHSFPKDVKVHRSSSYPFEVTLDQPNNQLLPGYHANLEIITDEAKGAVAAKEDALITKKNLYAWVMNDEGLLERRAVETGITENGLVEIKQGLKDGEWLAYTPKDEFRKQATFITPIKLKELYVKDLFEPKTTTIKTYGLLGLLAR
ncbi:HlyD family efflux transporter periplasmic adaptor subunit [Halobacillus rhizosphaerae]|uniref:efflux RND transporter periplasmic adaptor subunit n=1 Tax=Halobacillus rhizosphaerae TaxID=3064889 RepID=UPI00398B8650